jgi:hypothetical protein
MRVPGVRLATPILAGRTARPSVFVDHRKNGVRLMPRRLRPQHGFPQPLASVLLSGGFAGKIAALIDFSFL